MRTVIGEGEDVGLVEEGHEPQGPVFKGPEEPGRHVDDSGLDVRDMALEASIFLEYNPKILHPFHSLDFCSLWGVVLLITNGELLISDVLSLIWVDDNFVVINPCINPS